MFIVWKWFCLFYDKLQKNETSSWILSHLNMDYDQSRAVSTLHLCYEHQSLRLCWIIFAKLYCFQIHEKQKMREFAKFPIVWNTNFK